MIYKNTSHTAQEVIDALGVNPFVLGETEIASDEIIGKARVRIGGIAGIVDPEKIVKTSDSDTLEVIVGNKAYEIELEEAPEELNGVSEIARAVLIEEGKEIEKKAKAIQEAKKETVKSEDETE